MKYDEKERKEKREINTPLTKWGWGGGILQINQLRFVIFGMFLNLHQLVVSQVEWCKIILQEKKCIIGRCQV